MKISNNKKIFVFVVCIMLVLSSVTVFTLPKTYAKYVEDNNVVYKAKLYNLYDELSMKLENGSDYGNANLRFSFKPNQSITIGEKDQYDIEIPSTCKFKDVKLVANGSESSLSVPSSNKLQVSFAAGIDKQNVTTIVRISCKVVVSEDLNLVTQISETINGKEKIEYIKYSYKETYDAYKKHIDGVVDESISIPSSSKDMWAIFETWIKAYANYVGDTQGAIWEYVNSVYTSKADLVDDKKANILPGFSIKYNSKDDEYTFNIEKNFYGYARTYKYKKGQKNDNIMYLYFSATKDDKDFLDDVLSYYLNEYVFDDKKEAQRVYKYIRDNGRIYSVLFENNTKIAGLRYEPTVNGLVVLTKQYILSLTDTYLNKVATVRFSDSREMNAFLLKALELRYKELSSNQISTIAKAIEPSVTKNNTSLAKESFEDYYIVSNTNGYWLVRVWSDGKESNKVTVTTFTTNSGTKVEVESDTASSLKINISGPNKAATDKVVNALNAYFRTEGKFDFSFDVKSDTSTEYSGTYTLNK